MRSKNSPEVILHQYERALEKREPNHPDRIPAEFLFNSKVVVISEETEIPDYLPDDVLAFQLNWNRTQAMEMIGQNLDTLGTEYPELTLDDKKEILALIRHTARNGQSKVDLQTFLHVALIWKSRDQQKEAWIQAQF